MSFRTNNSKNYRNGAKNYAKNDPKQTKMCDVCGKNEFKYKCGKCTSQHVKTCSVACYKQHNESGEHSGAIEPVDSVVEVEKKELQRDIHSDEEKLVKIDKDLLTKYQPLLEDPKIQQLLQYNTVKYHLNKIYQLLLLDYKSIQEDTITSQKDFDMAIARYLSCFRGNGVFKNEAIEEFVLIVLKTLTNTDSTE